MLALAALLLTQAPASAECLTVVMDVEVVPENAELARVLTEAVATEIAAVTSCRAVTRHDVKGFMDFEADKQATGCDTSCLSQLASSLGAAQLVLGSVTPLTEGESVVSLRLIEVNTAKIEKRIEKNARPDPQALRVAVRATTRALFGAAALDEGPAPLFVGGLVAVGAGGIALVVGGLGTALASGAALDRTLATDERRDAQASGPLLLATAIAGALVAGAGGALMVLSP